MVGGDDRWSDIELVADREDFLERLADGPLRKRDIVEELDHSRSTVNRAVDALEAAGLVEATGEGVATTLAGRMALAQHREYLTGQTAVLDAGDALAPLPADAPVEPALLVGADVRLATEPTPYSALEAVTSAVDGAERVRAAMPVLEAPERLRACHRLATEGDGTVELVLGESLATRLREQLPGTLRELAAADGSAVLVGDPPPFGLQLADDGDGTEVAVTVYGDGGASHAVVTNDAPGAVEWADGLYGRRRDAATDVTGELQSLEGEPDGEWGDDRHADGAPASELPRTPARQGFRRLDEAALERREPAPPETCWRAGLDLVEVAAGYAIDREYDAGDDRRNLTDELLAGLRAGTDHAVVGPPGSGKSTVCKSVACRWIEAGDPVVYRKSGGRAFDATVDLAAYLRGLDGSALVVVEDAVRDDANAVFELLEEFRGDDAAVFLLDARRSEWHDADAFPAEARLRSYKREVVETVDVPPLDDVECRRFVDHFTGTVGVDLDVAVDGLVEEFADDEDGPTPDGVLLLLHRLSQYADPLAEYGTDRPTTLAEEVRNTLETLRERGDLPLDVGVAVNLLNAAGVDLGLGLVHALADGESGHAVVDETLDNLEGTVVFERDVADRRYRTVHDTWSRLFLEQLLEADGERDAHGRVGRCLTRMLELADDRAHREAVDWVLAGDAPAIREVAADPGAWADEFVHRLFALGREHPGLAPLFGETDYSRIELPDACSAVVPARCAVDRGRMYLNAGALDTAAREFERGQELAAAAGDDAADRDAAVRVRARGLSGLATVARRRGDLEAAESDVSAALSTYRELGDRRGEADALKDLGAIAWRRGAYEAGREHTEAALERYRALGAGRRVADCLGNLAAFAVAQGELAEAEGHAEAALERSREADYDRRRAQVLSTLGRIASSRADYESAAGYHRRALEIRRELGIPHEEAISLNNLGNTARVRGDLAEAERYLERSLELKREVGDRRAVANARWNLAEVARRLGDADLAEHRTRQCLETYREVGDRSGEGDARSTLGVLALDRGDHEAAAEHLEAAADLKRDVGDQQDVARVRRHRGRLALRRGDVETARERVDGVLEGYRDIGNVDGEGTALRLLGRVALAEGDHDAAAEHLAESLRLLEDVGNRFQVAATREALADLAREAAEPDRQREHLEVAARIHRECGAHRPALDVLDRLVDCCQSLDEPERALEHYRTAVHLAEEHGLEECEEAFRERYSGLEGASA